LYSKHAQLDILDVGTGSGCLLLAALSEFPNATGVGVDISPGALRVASENARRHGLDDRATFLHRDLVDIACGKPLANDDRSLVGCFDVVLSNPPYIPRRELSLVAPDVLEFEPHLALFSDPEGVARQLYRLLHQAMPSLLKLGTSDSSESKRSVLVEVGSEVQAHQVRDIFMSKQLESAVEFGTAELLLDGRSRHRAALFQTRA